MRSKASVLSCFERVTSSDIKWHQVTSSDIKWHQNFLCKTKWDMLRELQHICVTNGPCGLVHSIRSVGPGGPEAHHVLHQLAHHTVARLAEDPGRELGSDCHGYVTAMSRLAPKNLGRQETPEDPAGQHRLCDHRSQRTTLAAIYPAWLVTIVSNYSHLPSGKLTKNYGKSPFSMGKSTISMAIFALTLWLCQNSYWKWPFIVDCPIKNCHFQ